MLPIFLITLLQSILVLSQNTETDNSENPFLNEQCVTPNDIDGTCQYLNECEALVKQYKKDVLYKDDLQYLWRSQCGFFNKKTMVCCPLSAAVVTEKLPDTVVNRIDTIDKSNLLPKPGICGGGSIPRIINGNRTQIFEYPWMALLEYSKPKGPKSFHCGGSLINNRYVLTAAHCTHGTSVKRLKWTVTSVRLGEWDLNSDTDCEDGVCSSPPQNVPVEEILVHENYIPTQRSQYNDIALLRLARPVSYSDWIRPVCLPLDTEFNTKNYNDVKLKIVGWGKTENKSESHSQYKLHATVNGFDFDECSRIFRTSNRIALQPNQLCALGNDTDTCSGDSGGPILAWAKDTTNPRRTYYYAAGITSFGTVECAKPGFPAIYTRVSSFIGWILDKIKS